MRNQKSFNAGEGGFGHFDKHFVKSTRKKGNILEFFLLDNLKFIFWMEHFNPNMDAVRTFLSKIRTLFSKRAGEASTSLNMPKYSWKYLHKLFWLCQGSSDMFNRILKMSWVPNKSAFWIWHGCIGKGYAEFQIYLIMAPYAWVMPEYALVSLNMPVRT